MKKIKKMTMQNAGIERNDLEKEAPVLCEAGSRKEQPEIVGEYLCIKDFVFKTRKGNTFCYHKKGYASTVYLTKQGYLCQGNISKNMHVTISSEKVFKEHFSPLVGK